MNNSNNAVEKTIKHFDENAERIGQGVSFERIRRITGYLVGSVDRWCNSKKAELKDRVKHSEVKKNA